MIEPTQVIKFSERLACCLFYSPRHVSTFESNARHSSSSFLDRFSPSPSLSLSSSPDVSRSTLYSPARILSPYSSSLLFLPSFLSFPLFLSLPPLRRLAINHGAVHERCSRSNRSLSLSLFHSPRFLLLPVVAIYFTSLRRYRKLFAALASTGGHPRGIRSADHPRGEREIGRVKISRVPRPRDYGISGPMVIYDGPRREGKKKRYSNEHASSNRYILSSSSSSAFSPRARLSTPAHGSGADSQPPCR